YDENIQYPFKIAFLRSNLAFHPRPPDRVAICSACKNKPERIFPPYLYPIPSEIQAIPLAKRKYLSPIYLHSSLGRTPGVNPFNEYRNIVGTMSYSKNIRSFTLYSGMLGAFLELNENSNTENRGFHPTLINGSNWLKNNNPNLKAVIFPDLFSDGKGTYQNLVNQYSTQNEKVLTYGKYIKERIGGKDPRFRLHHTWPAWSYLQLEKYRNHQNNQRIFRQNQVSEIYNPPRAVDLIQRSVYNNKPIINEQITTTLPTFIRTGDS